MSDADHGTRAHATWSASSTAANWNCAGRLALVAPLVEKSESREAAWGTACHQVAETCLRDGLDADSFTGRVIKTKQHAFEFDDEMAETTQVYVDYVRQVAGNIMGRGVPSGVALVVEQSFSLASLDPPFDAGGTCDALVFRARDKHKHVIDLKAGRGVVVEARGNPQLRTYALGAVLANPTLDVERVTVTIVQPRAAHKDGRIRSETFHVADLIEWTADLVGAMQRSKTALDAREKMDAAHWSDTFLRAGDHCKFCPAADFCPALAKAALDSANAWFGPEGAIEIRPEEPADMPPERVAAILDKADLLEGWLNAVRARGQWLAESGTDVPGYQLVDKQARRKWRDADTARAELGVLFDDAKIIDAKLKSPAQLEKAIGRADYAKYAAAHVDNSSSGQNLVAVNKTTRPPAVAPATKFFGPPGDA